MKTLGNLITVEERFINLLLSIINIYTVFENHKKVAYNIASEASYIYINMDKSSSKMPKMVDFGEVLKSLSLRSNSVTRQVIFDRTKIGKKCKNSNATFLVIFKHCDLRLFLILEFPLKLWAKWKVRSTFIFRKVYHQSNVVKKMFSKEFTFFRVFENQNKSFIFHQ